MNEAYKSAESKKREAMVEAKEEILKARNELIAFTMSVDDFVISYFTAGPKTSTLAMTIYGMAKRRISPKMNAVSTLLFVSVLLLLIIVNVREARQEKARQAKH